MSVRLLLQGGGASPMRVLASGADPNNALFGDLLFDANYRALRLAQTATLNTFMTAAAGFTVASVPLFKTFSSPPLAVAMMNYTPASGGNAKQPPALFLPLGGLSPLSQQQGAGVGTTTTDIFLQNFWKISAIANVQARVLVFDSPM